MKLTTHEQKHFHSLANKYFSNSLVNRMREFVQHGSVSTYDHCHRVAFVSYWLNKRLRLGSDEQALITGALLHDFYLYDWHTDSEGMHGFTHPEAACKNAIEHFDINEKEQNIIRSHMWPLTLIHPPKCREAAIVCIADKYCCIQETLFQRKQSKGA